MGDALSSEKERQKQEETLLIARAMSGDRKALTDLIVPLRERLLKDMRRHFRNENEAEDLIQEALAKLFKWTNVFRGDSRYYTYAWSVARREALDAHRDRVKERLLLEPNSDNDADK